MDRRFGQGRERRLIEAAIWDYRVQVSRRRKGNGRETELPGLDDFEGGSCGCNGRLHFGVAMSGTQESGFKLRRREPDTLVQHRTVQAAERSRIGFRSLS